MGAVSMAVMPKASQVARFQSRILAQPPSSAQELSKFIMEEKAVVQEAKEHGMTVDEAKKLRCQHDMARYAQKAVGSAAMMTGLGCEALALVDERMGGDGTGKILGINDPILGVVWFGAIFVVFGLFSASTSQLGTPPE